MSEQRLYSEGDRVPVAIEDELKSSYLDYAMSVIIGRALPDVRDGLKPVHRRILYGMWEGGNTAAKAYKKSARIVGDVMGKYHPHGDAAIYDTAVRMAQDFSMRHVLIDGQGNFGSVDGDAPAAMRYTEIRLTRLAEHMLGDDIDKETVEWSPTYDGSLLEPVVLPARFPNLLVNGSSGIAVGMATNIPPHNLREIVAACVALIRNPTLSTDELLEIVPGPDFPTAAFIHGRKGIVDAYRTGRGIIQMRARADIEPVEKGHRAAIIVRELPYQVNKARLVEHIAALVQKKSLEGIADLRDESDRDGIRLVVELKRDAVPEVVLNNLYKLTSMQSTFGIILLAILDNQPRVFALRDLLQHFLDHRKEVVVRRTRFELARAEDRAHILEGLVRALDRLDEVIALIRQAADPAAARTQLMARLDLSEIQAQAILDMRLQRLTGLERDKVVEEHREVMALIAHLRDVLGSARMVEDIIVSELEEIRDRFGDQRRTQIITDTTDLSIEDLIAEEEMVLTVSRGGYVKRSALATYRSQRRGGRGRRGMATKEEDVVTQLLVASTHATLLFFTSSGKVFAKKVFEVPEAGPSARGRALVNLLNLEEGENVAALLAVRQFEDEGERFLLFATLRGKVKRTRLSDYANIRSNGLRAVTIGEDDSLLTVHLTDGRGHVFLGTHQGMAIRFEESEVRPMGRVAGGVAGVRLRKGDSVVEAATFDPDDGGDILALTELGLGKRTPLTEFRAQKRGGLGLKLIRLTAKTGALAGMRHVHEDDQVLMVTEGGMLIRTAVSEIRRSGRVTQGVRVIRLEENDRVVSVAKLVERDDNEGNGDNGDVALDGDDSNEE